MNNKKYRYDKKKNLITFIGGGSSGNYPVDVNSRIVPGKQWSGPNIQAPGPAYNGGLYSGAQGKGPWSSLPVTPTTTNYINSNLRSANPPPGALTMYQGTNRLGNNFQAMPGVNWFKDTGALNPGPHSIKCTQCGGNKKAKKSLLRKRNKGRKNTKKNSKKNNKKGGGCAKGIVGCLGQVNGCGNGRLMYDSQGNIGCNSPFGHQGTSVYQGGQAFRYPKNIVGGKKSAKKNKKMRKNKRTTRK